MKVGIVTQPLYANYGGILQNYALQQVLKRMGHEPISLDYMPSLSFGRYILYVGKGLLCALSPSKRHPIKPYEHFLKRPRIIDAFVKDNINLSKTILDYNQSILEKNGIEALIVGSDQVWRYSYNSHYIEDMYLDFAKAYPCRKIGYGVSFGVEKWDYPEAKTEIVRELVKQFDAVSVRERSAVKLCKENLGIDARVVLDPTLLLESSEYECFCKKQETGSEPYLAAYVLDKSPDKDAIIESIAKEQGLAVKEMTVSNNGCSIEDWLSSIKNAEYVVTDSYHGTLFSITFKKPFKLFINKERGADRFLTIFERLGIKDGSLDYLSVSTQLKSLREQSLQFLSENLD